MAPLADADTLLYKKGKGTMAIIAPSRPVETIQRITDGKSLAQALHPWRRRVWIEQILRWTGSGLFVGLVLACLMLIISRFVPWATVSYWAGAVATASLLCALVAALWYRPSFARAARLVDARLALHDRLSTAWELRDESTTLAKLQRRDALKHLGRHTPVSTISLWPGRAGLIAFGIVIIGLALLIFLPNPMTDVLRQQAAFQARVARQVAAINHIRTVIDSQTTTSAQERSQIDKILREAAANGDSKGLDAALQKLASQVQKMTPAQRAQLAQQIEQAANQARQNPQLSAALHQLAKA